MQEHTSIRRAGPGTDASQIPALETQRLRLRAFELRDLPAACAMWASPEVVRFVGGRARSESEVWSAFSRSYGHWALLGYGYLAILDRRTGEYFGQIGFLEKLRDVSPSHVGTPEVGWALAPGAWGKGIASEALMAVLAWSDEALEADRTVCLIDPENAASLRVARKCGYQHEASVRLGPSPSLRFERFAAGTGAG